MNIAILFRKPAEFDQGYSLDCFGRDGLKHIERVKDALQVLGHTPQLVDVNLDAYEYLRKNYFDLAFNLCDDGFRNNSLLEAHIPAMLDILQIPCTGSNFFTLATCVNKARTKEILSFHGIATPEFQVFCKSSEVLSSNLDFPVIVKPLHEDASIGLREESVVNDNAALKKRVDFVLKNYRQPALVEKFINGREVYVGILGNNKDDILVLPISEVIFDKSLPQEAKICSYEAKWAPETQQYKKTPVKCPARLSKRLKKKLIEIAKKAYILLGCSDYGRIDFRINNDQPYVLEVNPNPDISEDAGLAKMARAAGMNYNQLIAKIMSFALARNHRDTKKDNK
jgi:D-alanine-D-alanine ligase